MEDINTLVKGLIIFRRAMNQELSVEKVRYIWGRNVYDSLNNDVAKELIFKEKSTDIVDAKVKFVMENFSKLLIFKWVKFIGISGSVAAGFAKEDDDIDMFIVVKDGCAWIYRGILTIRGLFNGIFRAKRHGNDVKDKFCLNLICEERGLEFENDVFDFHELMYVIPVFNQDYLNFIYKNNLWLGDQFGVKKELFITRIKKDKKVNVFVRAINYLAFIAQYLFMLLSKHSPEKERLFKNFKKGKIEFFDEDYKKKYM